MVKNKLIKKNRKDSKMVPAKRVTNNTVESKRKEVIEKGRRFKYPVQYNKHKLVMTAIIIALAVLLAGSFATWYRLYRTQDTSTFMYRVSLFLPFPVADVDGERALYSDYLAQYRSNMSVTEKQEGPLVNPEDEQRRSDYYKRQSMDNVIANAYAIKLARENDITVSNEEIEEVFSEHRTTSNAEISESAFNRIIEDNYQLSPAEYRRMFIELPLLRQKVAAHIDTTARDTVDDVYSRVQETEGDFDRIATQFGDQVEVNTSGFVKLTNIDGGRTKAAAELEVGQISEPFISRTGDGYYIVQLLEEEDDEIRYAYIRVPFTEFNQQLESILSEGRVTEYIELEEIQTQ